MLHRVEGLRSSRSDAGFTLIDTLAVVAIICLVSAIALPSTASMMGGYKLKGNAQAISNLVGLAKMRASAQFSRAESTRI
jgi:Tfp pilus assembly protein FimT